MTRGDSWMKLGLTLSLTLDNILIFVRKNFIRSALNFYVRVLVFPRLLTEHSTVGSCQ